MDYMSGVDLSITVPSHFLRTTVSKIPTSSALASSSKLPMGGVIRPLAPDCDGPASNDLQQDDGGGASSPSSYQVPVINPSASGIVRCKRCRTYMNPFVAWLESGRRWRCNICGQVNDVPSAYFCHLDDQGNRRDKNERPELSSAVCEYIAPAEYMVRPPQPPCYVFVIDVSAAATRSGALEAAAQAIKASIQDLESNPRTQIGFVTYDRSVHFYNIKSSLSAPQMMVVSDLNELFIPAPDDLLVNLSDSKHVVEALLDSLPTMFASPSGTESCLGSALKAAFTLQKSVGGKMCVFQSCLPNISDGALKHRENPRVMGTSEEYKLLSPSTSWYRDTGVEFSRSQISVEMFVFPHQYVDIATLNELPKNTAGQLYTYPSFNIDADLERFKSDLIHAISRKTAFESVMRVRCTRGMRISNFYGNFCIRGQDLLALPNASVDTCFAFDLVHDEPMLNTSVITLQSALLYTSEEGERRIRVHTAAIPVTSVLSEVVNSVDADAICNLLSKQALDLSLKSGLDTARMRLQQVCIDIIKSAKGGGRSVGVYGANAHYPSQQKQQKDATSQETPESLALLPLYTMALQKNIVFRGGADVHPDERASHMATLRGMWISESRHFIYPRMFSVHDMDDRAGTEGAEGEDEDKVCGRNNTLLPEVVDLSVENLKSDGIFLLDNSVEMYLWVGRAADAAVLTSLFGMATLEGAEMSTVKLGFGNDLASRVNAIIVGLRDLRGSRSNLTIVREGDAHMEQRFFWHLVEDRASFHGTYSYADYMALINSGGGISGPNVNVTHQPPNPQQQHPQQHPQQQHPHQSQPPPPHHQGMPPVSSSHQQPPMHNQPPPQQQQQQRANHAAYGVGAPPTMSAPPSAVGGGGLGVNASSMPPPPIPSNAGGVMQHHQQPPTTTNVSSYHHQPPAPPPTGTIGQAAASVVGLSGGGGNVMPPPPTMSGVGPPPMSSSSSSSQVGGGVGYGGAAVGGYAPPPPSMGSSQMPPPPTQSNGSNGTYNNIKGNTVSGSSMVPPISKGLANIS